MQQRDTGVVGAAGFGVDVGDHGVALVEEVAHDVGIGLGIGPDAALGVGVLGGVRAQDRTVDAELDPARVEFGRDDAGHVPADVVAPVGIADVGCGRGEPWLKRQRFPHRNSVAGKANLVAMVA